VFFLFVCPVFFTVHPPLAKNLSHLSYTSNHGPTTNKTRNTEPERNHEALHSVMLDIINAPSLCERGRNQQLLEHTSTSIIFITASWCNPFIASVHKEREEAT